MSAWKVLYCLKFSRFPTESTGKLRIIRYLKLAHKYEYFLLLHFLFVTTVKGKKNRIITMTVVVVVMMIVIMMMMLRVRRVSNRREDEKGRAERKEYRGEEEKTIVFIKLLFDVLLIKKPSPWNNSLFLVAWV